VCYLETDVRTYHRDSFFAALKSNDSAAVAAGSSNVQVSTTTQKVLALQPIMPPAPPRSRSKSRVRAADDALLTSGVDPVQAASASAGDARAPLDPAAQPSHGAAAASAGGGVSRHSIDAVAAGSLYAHVSTKQGKTILAALAPGRYGSQPTTQSVLQQTFMPPAPLRSNNRVLLETFMPPAPPRSNNRVLLETFMPPAPPRSNNTSAAVAAGSSNVSRFFLMSKSQQNTARPS
jgi:hypothetical protein